VLVPQTHQSIDLQLFTDYVTLARIWSSSVRFHCPHAGADHETKVGAACLQTTLSSNTAIKRNAGGIKTTRGEVSSLTGKLTLARLIPKPRLILPLRRPSKCLQAFVATYCHLAAIFAHRQQKPEVGFG
jgi:hypothetical protein